MQKDMGVVNWRTGAAEDQWTHAHRILPVLVDDAMAGSVVYMEPADSLQRESLLVEQIDMLQVYVMDHLGRPTPKCPLHDHALAVNLVNDVAIWRCPSTGAIWDLGHVPRSET